MGSISTTVTFPVRTAAALCSPRAFTAAHVACFNSVHLMSSVHSSFRLGRNLLRAEQKSTWRFPESARAFKLSRASRSSSIPSNFSLTQNVGFVPIHPHDASLGRNSTGRRKFCAPAYHRISAVISGGSQVAVETENEPVTKVQNETRVGGARSTEAPGAATPSNGAPTFQEAIHLLQEYWAKVGCALLQPSNTEVGAGTMNPATFLRVLGPEPWRVAYVEPSVRPDDSRYGENPNRVQKHTQFQVILKPDPGNAQELYLGSLAALGIDSKRVDVRFVEDNWESPVLGAWGLGWEVWLNGMEVTQFTYFQQAGSLPLTPVSVEITYGLERIIMALQGVDHFKDIRYAPGISYGELFLENEREMSAFNLEHADVARAQQLFDLYDAEAKAMLERGLAIPAYDHVLKTSHIFNLLDARGAIGVTERARFFGRMRQLARQCAQLWVETRKSLGHPLGVYEEPPPPELPPPPPHNPVVALEPQAASRNFVLEIGSEELPPNDVTSAVAQLVRLVPALFTRLRLPHGAISVSGTPRRLAVVVDDLALTQPDSSVEVRGPPRTKAFDAEGQPSKALQGFCRKNGVDVGAIYWRGDERGVEYAFAVKEERGGATNAVLGGELAGLVGDLTFPKTMRWSTQVTYSRPIRWLLALYGEEVIPFRYAGLVSGRSTRLLRSDNRPEAVVDCADEYLRMVGEGGIMLSMEERRSDIWQKACQLAVSEGGRIPQESRGALLEEVANLVEAPVPLLGRFEPKFLELPKEVLVTVMRKHQRYFPVEEEGSGKLLPCFVAVPNGHLDVAAVRKGNEAVLRARFEDATFFYASDTLRQLSSFREGLKGITFHERLGSMHAKSERVEGMLPTLMEALKLSEDDKGCALAAAPLAMADLGTSVVTEFTNLAGVMGRHYAEREGQPAEVAEAVFECVLPRFAGDDLPKTGPGLALAVAHRLDSLVGLFAVGCEPSASADPLGLRRSAYALVESLVANGNEVDLGEVLSVAARWQPVEVSEETLRQVETFVVRRVEQLLVDSGAVVEIVRAILAERGRIPALAKRSVAEMEAVAARGKLEAIVSAYARPTRIVRGKEMSDTWQVDERLFEMEEERELWDAYRGAKEKLPPGVGVEEFVTASLSLVQPLESFFAKVFVMAEDETVRSNRLALLRDVANLPGGIVDLSLLPGF